MYASFRPAGAPLPLEKRHMRQCAASIVVHSNTILLGEKSNEIFHFWTTKEYIHISSTGKCIFLAMLIGCFTLVCCSAQDTIY